ncbi:hypothetical protein [Legionella saoudiensis]|uniref:hypothetical protein n=1 Tax=Legionella saoudiensis TaxID=1750561 RepID=UPI00072FBCD2|nr:hypothetical protein [Legionella saoudiensis]
MPIQPNDLLLLSKSLLNNAHEEAEFRTCSNRSYYACYQEGCRIAPKATGYKPPSQNKNIGHTDLHTLLSNHENQTPPNHRSQEDKAIIYIGVLMKQCFNLRVKADYRFNDTFRYNQAQMANLLADQIIKQAKLIP